MNECSRIKIYIPKRQRMHGAMTERYGLWIRFWWIYLANTVVESDGAWAVEIDVSR